MNVRHVAPGAAVVLTRENEVLVERIEGREAAVEPAAPLVQLLRAQAPAGEAISPRRRKLQVLLGHPAATDRVEAGNARREVAVQELRCPSYQRARMFKIGSVQHGLNAAGRRARLVGVDRRAMEDGELASNPRTLSAQGGLHFLGRRLVQARASRGGSATPGRGGAFVARVGRSRRDERRSPDRGVRIGALLGIAEVWSRVFGSVLRGLPHDQRQAPRSREPTLFLLETPGKLGRPSGTGRDHARLFCFLGFRVGRGAPGASSSSIRLGHGTERTTRTGLGGWIRCGSTRP